jgi:hypothetical protein
LVAIILILIGLMTRGIVVQERRSAAWDSSFSQNYCSVIRSSNTPLLGAEIRYWPIGLGVEDVNRWDWMARDYVSWLHQISPQLKTSCE